MHQHSVVSIHGCLQKLKNNKLSFSHSKWNEKHCFSNANHSIPKCIVTFFFFRFRIAKISHAGRTEVGKRADLLLFDENLSLLRTVVYGKVVFSNKLNETLTRNWLPQTWAFRNSGLLKYNLQYLLCKAISLQ